MTQQRGIKIVAEHRGVGIADRVSAERVARVRAEIDEVFTLQSQPKRLLAWLKDRHRSPESCLFAASLIEAASEAASEGRRGGPSVDLTHVRAHVVCIGHISDGFFYPGRFAPGLPPGEQEADHGFARTDD